MTRTKELPIGIEDFKVLIDNHYYFVDKTKLLCELVHNVGKVNLFTRPRRFGKTLTLSMIQYFFEKQPEDNACLFDGMMIADSGEEYWKHQGQYPVVTLSLKCMKTNTFEESVAQFGWMISQEFQRHPEIAQSPLIAETDKAFYRRILARNGDLTDYTMSVQFLTSCLMQIYGIKAIVLIDEYDVPLENSHFKGFYERMTAFIRSMFDNALKTNRSLEMAVLTGCLRVSKESLFTGLNNLQINSIQSRRFEEYFGFTESEVREMADYYGLSEQYPVIRKWYDGYLFGEREIYNPWSVLNFVQDARAGAQPMPIPYWSNTSSNRIVRKLITEADADTRDTVEELINGGSVTAPIHEDIVYADIDVNQESIWSFLLFTGYLKQIRTELRGTFVFCEMVIPNLEVKSIYQRTVLQWFDEAAKSSSRADLLEALLSGDDAQVTQIVGSWLNETISFYDEKEQYYHGFLAGLLSGFKGYRLRSNRESGNGRPDLILMQRGGETAFVIEIKAADPKQGQTLDAKIAEAFQQMQDNHYEEELHNDGYTDVRFYGAAFREKRCLIRQLKQ